MQPSVPELQSTRQALALDPENGGAWGVERSWLSAERDPAGIDLAVWRTSNTFTNWCLATILAGALAVVVHGPGVRWFHLAGPAAAVLFGTWPITVGFMWWLDERLHGPPYQPLLAIVLVHGVALFAALGACSQDDFGPGWAAFLLLGPCWGHLFPSNRIILVATLTIPLVERALFVPGASSRSFAFAAAFGFGVAISFWTFSARRLRARADEQRRLAREAFGAASGEEAAAWLTSMRLHDGLSGLLMLAHARAARGSDREALVAAGSFAQHARIILATFTPQGRATTDDLRHDLELFATRVGLTLDIDLALEAEPASCIFDHATATVESHDRATASPTLTLEHATSAGATRTGAASRRARCS